MTLRKRHGKAIKQAADTTCIANESEDWSLPARAIYPQCPAWRSVQLIAGPVQASAPKMKEAAN
jgi:hypothetical protein